MPEGRGALGGRALGRAIDAQQLRVASGQAQNAVTVTESHAEVAVGDAAVQGHGLAAGGPETAGEAIDECDQIGHRRET